MASGRQLRCSRRWDAHICIVELRAAILPLACWGPEQHVPQALPGWMPTG